MVRCRRSTLFYGALAALALLILTPPALLSFAWWEARWDPEVRRASVSVDDWPVGAKPVNVLVVTDTHVDKPDMPPARLARIVRKLNALNPDLVLLTGDYIGHKNGNRAAYSADEAIAPLALFKAPLGVVAVLGNHDIRSDSSARKEHADHAAFIEAIRSRNITLLMNDVVRRGPLLIGGLEQGSPRRRQVERSMAGMGPGARILLTHDPETVRASHEPVDAIFAGHTHCSQINVPFLRPLVRRYAPPRKRTRWLPCGRVELDSGPLFVGAGLGTSMWPLRFNAPPDVWLITFGPIPALAGGRSAP